MSAQTIPLFRPRKDTDSLVAEDGSSVSIVQYAQGAFLETRDSAGQLLFRFEPAGGCAVMHLPGGIELRAVDGLLDISCPGGVRIRTPEAVQIQGDRGTCLGASENRIEVTPDSVQLSTSRLDARVAHADYRGETLSARAEKVKLTWGKLERVAVRTLEYAREAYQRVEGLLHTRAGRVRTEAADSHLVKAGSARIQASGDVRVQADSIRLG